MRGSPFISDVHPAYTAVFMLYRCGTASRHRFYRILKKNIAHPVKPFRAPHATPVYVHKTARERMLWFTIKNKAHYSTVTRQDKPVAQLDNLKKRQHTRPL